MNDEHDKRRRVFLKLKYYFDNDINVFFKWLNPKDNKPYFRKGKILDLSTEMEILVLRENLFGEMPILLQEIEEETITKEIVR